MNDMRTLAILITIGFSCLGVLGDYFLKLASGSERPLRSGWFLVGFAVYASTAFGWVFVMRHLKLATISVVYSVSMILLLTTYDRRPGVDRNRQRRTRRPGDAR